MSVTWASKINSLQIQLYLIIMSGRDIHNVNKAKKINMDG